MAFSEFELKRIEHIIGGYCINISPKDKVTWNLLHFDYDVDKQSITLVEVRPDWRDNTITRRSPFVKITYVKSSQIWKMYWLRQNLQWDRYEPCESVKSLEEFVWVVTQDEYGCFFG